MPGSQVQHVPEVILVEGLFDYCVVAGWLSTRHLFRSDRNLSVDQFQQLCDSSGAPFISAAMSILTARGPTSSQQLAQRLRVQRIAIRRVLHPGQDTKLFFVQGGMRNSFKLLEAEPAMKFRLIQQRTSNKTKSPARVVEQDHRPRA